MALLDRIYSVCMFFGSYAFFIFVRSWMSIFRKLVVTCEFSFFSFLARLRQNCGPACTPPSSSLVNCEFSISVDDIFDIMLFCEFIVWFTVWLSYCCYCNCWYSNISLSGHRLYACRSLLWWRFSIVWLPFWMLYIGLDTELILVWKSYFCWLNTWNAAIVRAYSIS